ncbi:MAG: DoxX family protein [Opitutaceae bacterium]|nr:DoxX family protein [Opitutaceae bacterium]
MQLRSLLAKLDFVASSFQSLLLLAIRLYWGGSFALTGWGKLANLERTAGFFASLDLPLPKVSALLAGATECVGGGLLAVGLLARPAAVPLIFTMAVAYATAERAALQAITTDPDKFVTAAPFLFLFAAVLVLVFGPGRFALDALLFRGAPAKA